MLARLHTLAAADLVEPALLGRPGGPASAAQRLTGLAQALTARTAAPAMVPAAVVHGELLSLSPFGSADGVVARAASRLVLLARGLDPLGAVVPEEGHLELGVEAYAEALQAYR